MDRKLVFFFFNDTATTEIYTLSLHDALPISALYRMATVFAFPSLYEGFGLPPLEAMACGTPVVTSRISSLPEVVGDGALLVDPYSEEEIAQGIARVLDDENLRQRL